MKKILLSMLVVGAFFGLNANVKSDELSKADPKVQKMLKASNLEVVGTSYVKEKIGNGMRVSAKATLIDTRPVKKYMVGHVPTAINITSSNFEKDIAQLKDVDKSRELITYCGGWKCALSAQVADELKKEGFTNVKVYQAGYPEWKKLGNYSDVGLLLVKSAVNKGDTVIIDARPEKVFTALRIKGAINVPDTKFKENVSKLPKDKSQKIIVYCGGYKCEKSHIVAKELLALGYKNVSVYAAGLPEWQKEDLAVEGKRVEKAANSNEKAQGEEFIEVDGVKLVSAQDENKGMVYGPWYLEMIKNVPENIVLVDVRSAESYKAGHIPGAISIPFNAKKEKEFIEALKKLGDKTVVMNCAAGAMSTEASVAVENAKLKNVYYVDANIDCNEKHECTVEVNEPL